MGRGAQRRRRRRHPLGPAASRSPRSHARPVRRDFLRLFACFVGPQNQYIGFTQTFKTNPTWIAQKLTGFEQVQAMASYGNWSVSEYKGITDKNRDQSLWLYLLNDGDQAVLYTGTATRDEFAQFAKLLNLHFN